jgi:C4-dicarboxylate-specific signal transduction histidine kinase
MINRGILVNTDLASDLPLVSVDRVQFQQVLINLVINASDALSANRPGDRRITVRTCRSNGQSVGISVIDGGCGIPPDRIERIFEPFFTTKTHGMGLGLSVCRTIISAHRGTLTAANNDDRGATFHMTLQPAGTIL